ncbi:MAG TPA: hypothetical protein VLJ88_12575 [Propionibacteriaceae bacterium]|nr:hypothetical protein [Propionibacteriaceae bacterium]
MTKGRKGKGKQSKAVKPAPAPKPTPQLEAGRPSGQRFYDLPYSAPAPRLINPDIGLHNLVARAGHNAAYEIDVTLLDAPDHRLIRSGVLLAHRVLDGRGEWFMTAPDWQPLLPKDRIELMGHADLPEEFANLLRPLRRRATLGPVAALNCDRREFALRDDRGTTLALLRDDKVTVRRGGLTTARYREVMITPIGPGLTDEHVAWLDRAFTQAGATAVPRFLRLVARLGAPATGPTDLPVPEPFDAEAPFKKFVSQLLALRLRRIVEADLAIRGGDQTAVGRLADEAARLRDELRGLAEVLDAEWVEDLYDELGWISLDSAPSDTSGRDRLASRLNSERYLTVLERLVGAVRAPKLADARADSASQVLRELIDGALRRVHRAADPLAADSSDEDWDDAWQEMGRLNWVLDVAVQVLPDEAIKLQRRLADPAGLLAQVHDDRGSEAAALLMVADLTPQLAFLAGRDFERETDKARRTRREFVRAWSRIAKKLHT